MQKLAVVLVVVLTASTAYAQSPRSAADLAYEVYDGCLKEFSTACVEPKAMQWFKEVIQQDRIRITDQLAVVRTSSVAPEHQERALDDQEQLLMDVDNFLATHSLAIKAPAFFRSSEARAYVPDFLMNNALTKDAVVPLSESRVMEGRGLMKKVLLPFLLGLKFKTTVLVPLALAMIALKTWKAMTLGLLSLVLSGALVIFKIAKPKIVNYEVVHYPHHVDHIEHLPHHHHVEHVVPHHIEHIVPHHLDHHIDHHHIDHHHLDLPHHVDHVEHIEHAAPGWDPHAWARSSQEPQDAQSLAYNGQQRR